MLTGLGWNPPAPQNSREIGGNTAGVLWEWVWGPLQVDELLSGSLEQLLASLSCNFYTLARLTDENSGIE